MNGYAPSRTGRMTDYDTQRRIIERASHLHRQGLDPTLAGYIAQQEVYGRDVLLEDIGHIVKRNCEEYERISKEREAYGRHIVEPVGADDMDCRHSR